MLLTLVLVLSKPVRWDVYELPCRNRQRMIDENTARVKAEHTRAKADKKAEHILKEDSHDGARHHGNGRETRVG